MVGTGALKVAEQIKQITTQVLARDIKDPRVGFVTITEVRLSRDWLSAEIFYTVLGDDAARADTALALEAAKGKVRTAVAKGVKMRTAPTITFVADHLPEASEHFEQLLASVKAADAEIAARTEGAQFAGDEEPYRFDKEDGQ